MKTSGQKPTVFALSGGDPAQDWAQGRMKGFRLAIQKALPNATFLNTESNAINTSFNPGQTYDTYRTFLLGHPNVQFIVNVDIGAEYVDRAVSDLNRTGKVFTLGWNVSKGQLDAIEKGIQIALLDQRWPDQGAFGPLACANFLTRGMVLPNTQTLLPVTKADVPTVRAQFESFLSGSK
jgi:ABC-type sugar transport system substrate-binding protein